MDEPAQGSTGSLYLNFSLALLSIFATVLITLVTVSIPPGYQFQGFFCACLITGISGLVLLLAWYKTHRSSAALVAEIKARMPAPMGIQEESL